MSRREYSEILQVYTAVAQNTAVISNEVNIEESIETTVEVTIGLDTTTAHIGTIVTPQVSAHDSGNNWYNLGSLAQTLGVGTGASEAITNDPLDAGDDEISCASTTGFVTVGYRIIKDGTLANSEVVQQVSYDSNKSIGINPGVDKEHLKAVVMWNVADRQVFIIPGTYKRVRLLVDNTYDADGSSIIYAAMVSTVKGS